MKTFIYAVLLLIGLIVFKAFYWDSHHSSTVETNVKTPQTQMNTTDESNGTNPYTGQPLTEVGDTIAGKIKGKIQTH
jgi:hypothetical protein